MMYLIGWVDTSIPGYRTIDIGGTEVTITGGYQRLTDAVTALDSALVTAGLGTATLATSGAVSLAFSPSPVVLTWTDRLGWLLGITREPGDIEYSSTGATSTTISPALIPLIGAAPKEIDLRQESDLRPDRQLRGHGYIWGSAAVWRWTLTMTADAFAALQIGWCQRGKVTISRSVTDLAGIGAYDPTTNQTGYFDAYAMGIESINWLNDTRTLVQVTYLTTTAPMG